MEACRWLMMSPGGDGDPHDAVSEAEELLFLLLAVLKVILDQCLELRQVFLHALAVDVLRRCAFVTSRSINHSWP